MSRMWSLFSKRPNLNSSMPQLEGPFDRNLQQSSATSGDVGRDREYSRSPERDRISQSSDPQVSRTGNNKSIIVNNERYEVIDDTDNESNGERHTVRSEIEHGVNRKTRYDYPRSDKYRSYDHSDYDREHANGYSVRGAGRTLRKETVQSPIWRPVRFENNQRNLDEEQYYDAREMFTCEVVGKAYNIQVLVIGGARRWSMAAGLIHQVGLWEIAVQLNVVIIKIHVIGIKHPKIGQPVKRGVHH